MTERVDVVVVGLGALGSGTAWQLARQGVGVLGLEQFELGHVRGASHDSSRILRHSYHTPEYVGLTFDAYRDWADLEAETGEQYVTVTGGIDLFPPGCAIPPGDYAASMAARGVPFERLDPAAVADRWPQVVLPDGCEVLYQERTAVVPAARGTAAMQRQAVAHGAELRDGSPVTGLAPLADGVAVTTPAGTVHADRVVVTADAWTNQVLAPLDVALPLTVTQEQVTYFAPERPQDFAPDRFPVWIWMDDPSFYGFPCYGEPTVKAAQDCGGPEVSAQVRSFDVDPAREALLASFMARVFPASGRPARSSSCLYTLTPDRDFLLDAVPGHERVLVGLGAAHGFKFAPTFGRLLADLATGKDPGVDLTTFRWDRPGLTDPGYVPSWLV